MMLPSEKAQRWSRIVRVWRSFGRNDDGVRGVRRRAAVHRLIAHRNAAEREQRGRES